MVIQSQEQIEGRIVAGRIPDWACRAYRELHDKVADAAFPCTFGTTALAAGDVRFAIIDDSTVRRPSSDGDADGPDAAHGDEAVVDSLASILASYASFVRSQPVVRASMQPLAVLMRPPVGCRTLDDYFARGWRLLAAVHARDPAPWPERIPRDPDDPGWSFCFGGVPLFINFKTPLHRRRRSRYLGGAYLWLVQARDGFDVVAGDTLQGRNARRIIRDKLAAYDDVAVYPELAHYGTTRNREWKQYFVPDTNEEPGGACPFVKSGEQG